MTWKTLLYCLGVVLALTGCSGPALTPRTLKSPSFGHLRPPTMESCDTTATTAGEILRRMKCEYDQLNTYHDTGVALKTVAGHLWITTFETHATRDKFRLEYNYSYPAGQRETVTLWADGQSAYRHLRSEAKTDTLDLKHWTSTLLWAMDGGYLVPSMLLNVGPIPWETYKAASTVTTTTIRGIPCFHVSLSVQQGGMQFWIGKSDFLLRKISFTVSGATGEVYYESIDTARPLADAVFVRP